MFDPASVMLGVKDPSLDFERAAAERTDRGIFWPMAGIVLRLRYTDEPENVLAEKAARNAVGSTSNIAGLGTSAAKGSAVTADVLITQSHREPYFILQNCLIQQGKTSRKPDRQSPRADFSEEYPTPCSGDAAKQVYQNNWREIKLEDLDGDFVVVQCIGGRLTQPVVTGYLSHPANQRDAAERKDGNRFFKRFNGTEVKIEKDGDFYVRHRKGTFLNVTGDGTVQLKTSADALIKIDSDGHMQYVSKGGNTIYSTDNGIALFTALGQWYTMLDNTIKEGNIAGGKEIVARSLDVFTQVLAVTGASLTGFDSPKGLLGYDALEMLNGFLGQVAAICAEPGTLALVIADPVTGLFGWQQKFSGLAALITEWIAAISLILTQEITPPGIPIGTTVTAAMPSATTKPAVPLFTLTGQMLTQHLRAR